MRTDAHKLGGVSWRAVTVLVLLVGLAQAQSIRRTGYVTDEAGVIDPASEDTITAMLAQLREQTQFDNAIVTVNSTSGSIESLADQLFTAWNQGELGFILIVSVQDRKWWIATSDLLQSTINASYRSSLEERCLKPNFRAGNYSAGLIAAVGDLSGRLPSRGGSSTTYSPSTGGAPGRSLGSWGSPGLCTGIGCVVAFLFLIGILNSARRWTPGGWGGGGYTSRPYGGGGWGGGWGRSYGPRRSWGSGWSGSSSSGWSSGRSSWGSSGGSSSRSSSSGGAKRSTYSGGGGGGSW